MHVLSPLLSLVTLDEAHIRKSLLSDAFGLCEPTVVTPRRRGCRSTLSVVAVLSWEYAKHCARDRIDVVRHRNSYFLSQYYPSFL